jgi:RNA recognition motif-containing protein
LIQKKQDHIRENGFKDIDFELVKIDDEIGRMHHKIHHLENEINKDRTKFRGIAFVSFRYEDQKQKVLDENQSSIFERFKVYMEKGES